jgi:hypothetical protein
MTGQPPLLEPEFDSSCLKAGMDPSLPFYELPASRGFPPLCFASDNKIASWKRIWKRQLANAGQAHLTAAPIRQPRRANWRFRRAACDRCSVRRTLGLLASAAKSSTSGAPSRVTACVGGVFIGVAMRGRRRCCRAGAASDRSRPFARSRFRSCTPFAYKELGRMRSIPRGTRSKPT